MRVITLLFIMLSHALAAQSVKGVIIDAETESPLPFANVSINHKNFGSSSNLEGSFNLQNPEILPTDTLVVSYIGYNSVELLVAEVRKMQGSFIKLEPSITVLKEIQVLPQEYESNPKKIVSNAIENIILNCNSNKYTLKGFYRQIHREDENFKRLIEAAVTIYDQGYSNSSFNYLIHIPELRRSYDFRELKNAGLWAVVENSEKISKNSLPTNLTGDKQTIEDIRRREQKYIPLEDFFKNDLVRSFSNQMADNEFGFLNKKFLTQHKFKLESLSTYEGQEVYVIKILPSSSSKKFQDHSRGLLLPVGKIYIRTKDFAILQVDYNYILNPKKKGSQDYLVQLRSAGTGIAFSVSAKYKMFEGDMYLASLRTFERDPVATGGQLQKKKESGYTKGYFYLERQYITTEIFPDWDTNNLGSIEEDNLTSDLYSIDYDYNPEFWENYTILQETALESRIINDLEKQSGLEEQFKKGQ